MRRNSIPLCSVNFDSNCTADEVGDVWSWPKKAEEKTNCQTFDVCRRFLAESQKRLKNLARNPSETRQYYYGEYYRFKTFWRHVDEYFSKYTIL